MQTYLQCKSVIHCCTIFLLNRLTRLIERIIFVSFSVFFIFFKWQRQQSGNYDNLILWLADKHDPFFFSFSPRVALRIRPSHNDEKDCLRIADDGNTVYLGTDRAFHFDFVYPSHATQEQVYESSIPPLLTSFIEG